MSDAIRRSGVEFDESEIVPDRTRVALARTVRTVRDRLDEIWKRITQPNAGDDALKRNWMNL